MTKEEEWHEGVIPFIKAYSNSTETDEEIADLKYLYKLLRGEQLSLCDKEYISNNFSGELELKRTIAENEGHLLSKAIFEYHVKDIYEQTPLEFIIAESGWEIVHSDNVMAVDSEGKERWVERYRVDVCAAKHKSWEELQNAFKGLDVEFSAIEMQYYPGKYVFFIKDFT